MIPNKNPYQSTGENEEYPEHKRTKYDKDVSSLNQKSNPDTFTEENISKNPQPKEPEVKMFTVGNTGTNPVYASEKVYSPAKFYSDILPEEQKH